MTGDEYYVKIMQPICKIISEITDPIQRKMSGFVTKLPSFTGVFLHSPQKKRDLSKQVAGK
jgi:hypothetical protein